MHPDRQPKKRGPKNYFVPPGAKFTIDMGTSVTARRIRAAMRARGESARSTAMKAELSADSVRHVLSGKSGKPRMATLKAIATTLSVPVAYFTDLSMSEDVPPFQPQPDILASASAVSPRSMAQLPKKASPIAQMLMRGRHLDGVTLGRENIEVHSGAYTFPEMMLANLSPSVGRPALTRAPSDFLPQVRDGDLILVDLLGDPEGDDLVVHAVRGPHGYRWRMSKCREVIAPDEGEPPMLRFLGVLSADLGKK